MKFSLAVALSHGAELFIMDEPTAGLDPLARSELLDILATLIQDERKSVFFSTHVTPDLDKIADFVTLRLCGFYGGKHKTDNRKCKFE